MNADPRTEVFKTVFCKSYRMGTVHSACMCDGVLRVTLHAAINNLYDCYTEPRSL